MIHLAVFVLTAVIVARGTRGWWRAVLLTVLVAGGVVILLA